jgi:toxin ParE1/3/4
VKPVIVSAIAQRDIDTAAAWYENRKDGLGIEFLDRVAETLERIETNPEGYAEGYRGLRRANLDQFPYGVWFRIMPDNSLVIACLHGRRHPVLARERGAGVIEFPKPEPG